MQIDTLSHLNFPPDTPAPRHARHGLPDSASPQAGAATSRARPVVEREDKVREEAKAPTPSTIVDIASDRKAMPAAVYAAPRSAQGLAHAAVLRRHPSGEAPATGEPAGPAAQPPVAATDPADLSDAPLAAAAAIEPARDAPASDAPASDAPVSAPAAQSASGVATTLTEAPPARDTDFVSVAVKAMREFADTQEQARQEAARAGKGQGTLHGVRQLVSRLNVFA